MLRKTNLRMGTADVYKQNKNQEEDMLTTERLKKGYQMPLTQYELQSLVFNASENKLIRLEKAQKRSQSMIASVIHKKGEFHMNYDRERKIPKEQLPCFAPHNWKRILSDRVKFFSALARGTPLQQLSQRIPGFRRKELLFLEFSDYNISYDRAIWCVKLLCILGFNSSSKTQKKTLLDVATLELSQACNKTTIWLVTQLYKSFRNPIKRREATKTWNYLTGFMKYMFDDGVLDKQEFLNDLTEVFNQLFLQKNFKNPSVLSTFMKYYVYFVEDLSSSLVLARRSSTLLCQALGFLFEMAQDKRKIDAYYDSANKTFIKKEFENEDGEIYEFEDYDDFIDMLDEIPDVPYFDETDKTPEAQAEELIKQHEKRKAGSLKKSERRRRRGLSKNRPKKMPQNPSNEASLDHDKVQIKQEPMDYDEYGGQQSDNSMDYDSFSHQYDPSYEPLPFKPLHTDIPKKLTDDEEFKYMKIGKRSVTPERISGRYGSMTYPFWIQQGGVGIDPPKDEVLDFSNPTPTETVNTQPQIDFESSPSASPALSVDKENECEKKEDESKTKEKNKDKEKDKEKEKSVDEHTNDLDVPINPDDAEMADANDKTDASEKQKLVEEEPTGKENEDDTSSKTAKTSTSAEKSEAPSIVDSNDKIDKEPNASSTSNDETSKDDTVPMESDPPAATEKPKESTEITTEEPLEVDKAPEVDKSEKEHEDDIMIIESNKKADEDDCVVIAVVDPDQEQTPESEKKKDGEEERDKNKDTDVADNEPEKIYTDEELAEIKIRKEKEMKIATLASHIKEKMVSDKKWKEKTSHAGWRTLDQCSQFSEALHLLSSMVQYMACVTPESFVWNDLSVQQEERRHRILPQLCGSPLDYLPCELHKLPVMEGVEEVVDCLRLRHCEIVRRSQAAEDRWLPNAAFLQSFGRIIDTCVDVIGIMDNIDVEKPNAITNAGLRLFAFREKFEKQEALLKTMLMFKWCITEEREGSFRATYIAKLLRFGMDQNPENTIGGWQVMDLFFKFMSTEGPKHGSKMYQAHFDSTVAIMIEMMREKIFSITDILRELEKDSDLDYNAPLMERQRKQKIPKISKRHRKPETPDDTKLVHFTTEYTPKRLFMGKKMDLLERMIIILPQLDVDEDTDEYRLRRLLLFGLKPAANVYFRRARAIYKSITKEFTTRLYIEFDRSSKVTTAHKKINQNRLDDLLRQFRAQTYHDQHLILERIVYNFIDGIGGFLKKNCDDVPAPEVANIICEMYEFSMDITSIFDFFEMVNPYLKAVDDKIAHFRMDVLPDMYYTETAFIFVSFFMKHWQRFLLHPRACAIVNQCFVLIQDMIRADDHMITCWGRTVAIFVFHARKAIANAGLQNEEFLAEDSHFWRVFPNAQHVDLDVGYFNEDFAGVKLQLRGGTLRYDSYNDFKWLVSNMKPNLKKKPHLKRPNTRYSFVVRAFMEARQHGRNFDRINELANYCANITANDPPLSEYWIGAIKGLCFLSLDAPYPFKEMSQQIDISDCSTHYSLTTFITCLAGKSAFYIPRLLAELTKHVFPLMLRHDGRLTSQKTHDVKRKVASKTTESRTLSEAEPGVCLCLLIICGLCCVGDEPFGLSVHYRGIEKKKKRFNNTADERIMHLFHWFEMDHAMFRTLGHISQLLEALQSRCRDANLVLPKNFPIKNPPKHQQELHREKAPYRPQYLFNIAKTVQFVICEQDWVTLRMFRFFQTRKMEAFNQDKLKQNCLGQQILRMALRRRTERENVHKLFEAHKISKKATVDKVLSFMNLWNFRATLFDLMLMIKEISPDGNSRHAQQGAIAADALMSEIGKCCRDMFLSAYKTKIKMPIAKTLTDFRLSDINKFWLIAPLVRMCPKPINIPPQYANTTVGTVAAKFLREAALLMDTPPTTPKERLLQCSWAMSKVPFINMILTCLQCEKMQQSKDVFLQSLYTQLQRETLRDHHRRSNWTNRREHRDCTIFRITLIGYIYKEILKATHVETWGLLIFQLMFHGIINPVREKLIYETCFDMLHHMVLWTLVDGDSMNQHDRYGSIRVRWPQYAGLMKKIRKEMQERFTDQTRNSLHRFLPIGKMQMSTISYKKYQKRPKVNQKMSKKFLAGEGLKNGKYSFLPEEKAKTNAFEHTDHLGDLIVKGGWKFRMFQTTRLDKVAKNVQNVLRSNMHHTHVLEFNRPQLLMSDNMFDDIFLAPPDIEITKIIEQPVPVIDEEEAKKRAEEEKEAAEKKEESKNAEDEKNKNNAENKKDTKEGEKGKSKDKEKDGEKEKCKDASKKDDVTSEKNELEKRASDAAAATNAPETNKDMDTSTPKPAPVTRSPATRGRGGGRKRNSGARGGGPRAKRANSRADTAQAAAATTQWNAPIANTSNPAAGGNFHAAMRGNQPPMSNGSSDETKVHIRNLLNRKKEEKRNSLADASAAAAAANSNAMGNTSSMPPSGPPMPMGSSMQSAGATQQLQGMQKHQMGGSMSGMNQNMGGMNQSMSHQAPPPYSSTNEMNRPLMNQYGGPHFAAPNPGPLNRSSGPVSSETRQQIMEQQMREKLAAHHQLVEQQKQRDAREREAREREAREHQERMQREAYMKEQQLLERKRAIEENNRIMEEQQREREMEAARKEAARRAAEEAYAAEQQRLELLRRQEEERLRKEAEERMRIQRENEERVRQEQMRLEAEERERIRRAEEERIQKELEDKVRREKEEAARQEKERQEQEARMREAREAELSRQRMEQQRRSQQNPYMNQQGQYSQQPPPSYQQSSYPNNYQPGQQGNQPPNYQQPSHQSMQQGHQAGYQQTSNQMQMNMQQQQNRQQGGPQQSFSGPGGINQPSQPGYSGYNQQGGQGQQGQMQQQRNPFGNQQDMQQPGAAKLMHAKPNEAHAQQYQHTQNQLSLAQKEKEKQYFQAKNLQASQANAQQQQQRFGDVVAGNVAGYGRPYGQQQLGASDQMGTSQLPGASTSRMNQGSSNPQGGMQSYQQQQPVLGQPGPIQTGQSTQQQIPAQSQQQYNSGRPQMHTTPTKNDMSARAPSGAMGQIANRMGHGTNPQGYGSTGQNVPGGYQQGQQQSGQGSYPQAQQQQPNQYSGSNQQVGQQAQQQQQQPLNQNVSQSQSAAQFGRPSQDSAYQQSGYNQTGNQSYQRPDQQQQGAQQNQWSGSNQAQNQLRSQQQAQQPLQQPQQSQQFQQPAQQAKNPMAQSAQYGGFGGQQQGYDQQQQGQIAPQQAQNPQASQSYGQQQTQQNRYGMGSSGYTANSGGSSNILNQSMEESGLNQGFSGASSNASSQQGGSSQMQQSGYGMPGNQMQMQQNQKQQVQRGMPTGMGQTNMGQSGMGQSGMGQTGMSRSGLGGGIGQQGQQSQQPQQPQVSQQQNQRGMNPGAQLPPYSTGQQQHQPQQSQISQQQQQQDQYRRMQAAQMQQQPTAQGQQNRMGMPSQQQSGAAYSNQMQFQGVRQGQQGMGGMGGSGQQQPQTQPHGSNQYYQQQQDQRMQQQPQQPGQQQQHGYGMGQYPNQQPPNQY
ncbi:Mediator of RNA polymerase II transcription subunit 12 [Caenorhabditis elegans]|uniref:Mediator of RNA polymerase II transcription subunit 12 n=1 Tax=Caenorhabditis elegans TaxID=6239 RepID=MED12_CAEEL|nr:Mediator of RNA polymerase II transcription subunit 12 [Caenorhabditis elegans]Q20497.2 RecName: Full=Mediator of RNA polymerase II transcription subunit 12; AltName: Full=CeTRAP230; AltName: Full=Mediator complex subunit 12; AltName: Full=Protein dumpy-22 [Caenorhabditis elegans]CAA90064.1 Mediator of RNA polymerase II transcription subunit 12 [Caenorhabditis elegans]|eukprot:NP_509645.1 Mediator of RNA polymerase II transcription subunit 12 [Caenorhabditis elegans]